MKQFVSSCFGKANTKTYLAIKVTEKPAVLLTMVNRFTKQHFKSKSTVMSGCINNMLCTQSMYNELGSCSGGAGEGCQVNKPEN